MLRLAQFLLRCWDMFMFWYNSMGVFMYHAHINYNHLSITLQNKLFYNNLFYSMCYLYFCCYIENIFNFNLYKGIHSVV